jgi:hypothetical protein
MRAAWKKVSYSAWTMDALDLDGGGTHATHFEILEPFLKTQQLLHNDDH